MADNIREWDIEPELAYTARMQRRADGTLGVEFDQFSAEAASATCGYTAISTTATNKLLTSAVTGKYLHTRYVYLASPKKTTFLFHDGNTSVTKMAIRCASGGSVNLAGIAGPVFKSAAYVSVSSAATGATCTIGGVRDPVWPSL